MLKLEIKIQSWPFFSITLDCFVFCGQIWHDGVPLLQPYYAFCFFPASDWPFFVVHDLALPSITNTNTNLWAAVKSNGNILMTHASWSLCIHISVLFTITLSRYRIETFFLFFKEGKGEFQLIIFALNDSLLLSN